MTRGLLRLFGAAAVAAAGLVGGYFGYQAFLSWLLKGQGSGETREGA